MIYSIRIPSLNLAFLFLREADWFENLGTNDIEFHINKLDYVCKR